MSSITTPQVLNKVRSGAGQRLKDMMEKFACGPDLFQDARALEALLSNTPIFTREVVEQTAKQTEQFRAGNPSGGKERSFIFMPHFLSGGITALEISIYGTKPSEAVRVFWISTFGLAVLKGKNAGYSISARERSSDFTSTASLKPNDDEHPLRQRIAAIPAPLRTHLDRLTVGVENIVCVTLGSCFEKGQELERTRVMQHILTCSVSSHLFSSATSQSPIPVFARDPRYSLKDMRLLSHLSVPITLLSEPYHYLSITPPTLLINIGLPTFAPVHEIAADVCFPPGPIAILGNEIFEHPWYKEGKSVALDQWTPRLGKMLEGYRREWVANGLQGRSGVGGGVTCPGDWAEKLMLYARKE